MFDIKTRINRATFIVGFLLAIIFETIVEIIYSWVIAPKFGDKTWPLFFLFILFGAAYVIILGKKRANDISGEKAILLIVLYLIVPFSPIVFALLPSDKSVTNQYGPQPPKGVHLSD